MAYQQTTSYTIYQLDKSPVQRSILALSYNSRIQSVQTQYIQSYALNVRTGRRTPLLDLLPGRVRTDHGSTWARRGDVRRPNCWSRTRRTDRAFSYALSSPLVDGVGDRDAAWLSSPADRPDSPSVDSVGDHDVARFTAVPGLSQRTDSLWRLTSARQSHSVGSKRRPCRPAKYSFVPSHTETTSMSHGLKLDPLSLFDHKSCRPLLTCVSYAVKISSLFCDFISQTR